MVSFLAALLVKSVLLVILFAVGVAVTFSILNFRLARRSRTATPVHRGDFDRESIYFLASAMVLDNEELQAARRHKQHLKRFLRTLEK